MNLYEMTLKNRSWRGFDESRKISHDELIKLISLARIVPSAVNRQPLRYYLACTPDECAKIQPHTHWAGAFKDIHLPYEGHMPTAFIVICVDKSVCPVAVNAGKDVGIAAQTMLLGAVEMGLGGIMIGAFDRELHETLALPENLEISLVIALGKPDEHIEIVDAEGENTIYYRKDGVHYVPKRKMEDIIINGGTK